MIRIRNFNGHGITIPHLLASAGQGWCVIGSNNSGVDQFCDVIGQRRADSDFEEFFIPETTGVFTFNQQQTLFEEELRKDDTDFMGRLDPGTPAAAFLSDIEQHLDLVEACNMTASLHKGYRQLSSGQSRKLCLLREITRGVSCLVVQNPYEGVDPQSCRDLNNMFLALREKGMLLIMTLNNIGDIPFWCTHVGAFTDGTLSTQGPREEVLPQVEQLVAFALPTIAVSTAEMEGERLHQDTFHEEVPLVKLCKGFAGYGEQTVFSGLDISISEGQHTLVSGPNGSGKSTLVQLITGDHPLCYSNDLKMFGIQRGSGESIWDIKRNLGVVSPDLHRNHYIPGSSQHVVLSGLFDSIGLYQKPNEAQQQLASKWLHRLGMADSARHPFRQLTYAQQRLLLIARALIKVPRLLLLDELTQGLDQTNRTSLLDLLENVAAEQLCTILYVSHREDEYRPFFRQHLVMGQERRVE